MNLRLKSFFLSLWKHQRLILVSFLQVVLYSISDLKYLLTTCFFWFGRKSRQHPQMTNMNWFDTLKPGFHLQQTPRPRHKKQSDYVVEQSSFPLIALFRLKTGRCRGRNSLYGNQALSTLFFGIPRKIINEVLKTSYSEKPELFPIKFVL